MMNDRLTDRMAKLLVALHSAALTAGVFKADVFRLGTPEDDFIELGKRAVEDELADKKAAIERMTEENKRLKDLQEKTEQEKDAEIEALKARLLQMGETV